MRAFLKSTFWSFLTVSARTGSALLINKLVALQFGPNGITLLAHFQNLLTLATTVPSDGINQGLISLLAAHKSAAPDYRRYFWAGAVWQLLAFVLTLVLFFSRQDFYLGAFLQSGFQAAWLGLFCGGLLLLLLAIFLQGILLSRQALPYYSALVSLASLASAGLIWYFLDNWPLAHLLLLYLGGQAFIALVAVVLVAQKGWLPRFSQAGFQPGNLAAIGRFILMALTLVLCSKLVSFYVRDLMIRRFDLYQTGLWQAVVKLSDSYTMVFTSVLGMMYYPRLAALVHEEAAFRQLVRRAFYRLVPLIGLGLLVFYVGQQWFIRLLFDQTFLPAAYLLDYQVLGDFFKMSAWILSYIITVQGRTAFYIILQLAAAGGYLLLLFAFVSVFGLKGVTMAHCASFGLFLLFNLIYFRKIVF